MNQSATALQKLSNYFLWLLHQIDNPAICLSLDGGVVALNDPACKLFHTSRDKLEAQSFSQLLNQIGLKHDLPEDLTTHHHDVMKVFSDIPSETLTQWSAWHWQIHPLKDPSSKVFGLILFAHRLSPSPSRKEEKETEKPFRLQQLIQEVIEYAKPFARNRKLEITAHFNQEVPQTVIGPNEYVYRILQNILKHSIKHTYEGYIFVSVALLSHTGTEGQIGISVQDTGRGIPIDPHQTHIEEEKPNETKDTDLQLYAIHQMVEELHGSIHVDSHLNHGSTISLVLPFRLIPASMETVSSSESTQAMRILIIEDDILCQNVLKTMIQELHYSADAVSNAHATLELLKTKKEYHLIFMDIGLPDKDGVTLTREIRTKHNIHAPIVAITSHEWDKKLYAEAGFSEIIKNPITKEKLKHILFRTFSGQKVPLSHG